MSIDVTGKAIFITNTFAQAHPQEHIKLWAQFEKEVPFKERSGMYGADNQAYVKWLKQQNNPLIQSFLKDNLVSRSF